MSLCLGTSLYKTKLLLFYNKRWKSERQHVALKYLSRYPKACSFRDKFQEIHSNFLLQTQSQLERKLTVLWWWSVQMKDANIPATFYFLHAFPLTLCYLFCFSFVMVSSVNKHVLLILRSKLFSISLFS